MTVVAVLRSTLGDIVDVTEDSLEAARADRSGHSSPGRPLAVVHAETIEHVQQTMRIATETRTPVVVRGAGEARAGTAHDDGGARLGRDPHGLLDMRDRRRVNDGDRATGRGVS